MKMKLLLEKVGVQLWIDLPDTAEMQFLTKPKKRKKTRKALAPAKK